MFENIGYFFKRIVRPEQKELGSKDAAKERLHLVLMQDRANVSADFLELMKQEIIDVIKKYIVVDESSIDVRLTNQSNDDGTTGAPSLYANIPIVNIKNDMMAEKVKEFEGVDFNKEMGITNNSNENNLEEIPNEKEETNQPLEIEPLEAETLDDNKTAIIENYNKENIEEDEILQNDEEDEDDDVTFDDLLKAAEQEDKEKEEQNKAEIEIENKEEINVEENKEEKKKNKKEDKKEEKKTKTTRKRKTTTKEKNETETTND